MVPATSSLTHAKAQKCALTTGQVAKCPKNSALIHRAGNWWNFKKNSTADEDELGYTAMSKIPETPDLFQIPRRNRRSGALVLVLVAAAIVTAASLRPGATSVGPVLPELMDSLGMSGGLAGLLVKLVQPRRRRDSIGDLLVGRCE